MFWNALPATLLSWLHR